MNIVIDLGSELLVDRSRIRSPHLRLLLLAIGRPVVRGSAWIAVKKEVAAEHTLPIDLIIPERRKVAVA